MEPSGDGVVVSSVEVVTRNSSGTEPGEGFLVREPTKADKRINERVEEIANNRGTSMAVVAVAWSLSKPFIPAPILGMSKSERVDEATQAIEFKLSQGG